MYGCCGVGVITTELAVEENHWYQDGTEKEMTMCMDGTKMKMSYIRGSCGMLRWDRKINDMNESYGHVLSRDYDYIRNRALKI